MNRHKTIACSYWIFAAFFSLKSFMTFCIFVINVTSCHILTICVAEVKQTPSYPYLGLYSKKKLVSAESFVNFYAADTFSLCKNITEMRVWKIIAH